jgi:protein-tyrosine phosphatase
MSTVLLLCTGNYYRSRFAELLFNHRAEQAGSPWRADSRGLALERGIDNVGPIAPLTLSALERLGVIVPPPIRFPQSAVPADFEQAGRVVALLESEHRPLMQERFPAWADRIEYWQVHDVNEPPVLALMEAEVARLLGRLMT